MDHGMRISVELGDLSISYCHLFLQDSPTDCSDSDLAWEEAELSADEAEEAERILAKSLDRCRIPNYIAENDASVWDHFYKQHRNNFFKDRHYLQTAFPVHMGSPKCLVELGCGVGNTMLPLLEQGWSVYGLDFSQKAIDTLKEDLRFQNAAGRTSAQCCDLTNSIPHEYYVVADVASLLFCMSAIQPSLHKVVVDNALRTLKPGGVIVVRDYGRFDLAQMQLAEQRRKLVSANFYRKQDGTKCYYFSTDDLKALFQEKAIVLECKYICRVYLNRKEGTKRRRVWVQGCFQKI